jgi:hypothetical protein
VTRREERRFLQQLKAEDTTVQKPKILLSTEDTSGLLQQFKAEDTTVQKPKILQSTEDTSGLLQGTAALYGEVSSNHIHIYAMNA